MPKLRLSTLGVMRLRAPALGPHGATRQLLYYDSEQPGLAVRVTSGGSRVWIVEAWPAGRTVRVKLGRVTDFSLAEARRRARIELGRISAGVNPNQEKRLAQARSATLGEVLEDYLATRKSAQRLAERTEYDYRRLVYGSADADGTRRYNGYLSPWCNVAIASITPEMVARRHAQLVERSGAQANYAMRLFSALYNFARAKYRTAGSLVLAENPVRILSETKAWVRIGRRNGAIRPHELAAWFGAVRGLERGSANALPGTVRAYLQFLLLYGLRRGEAARLKWRHVDLKARTFTLVDPKNHQDHTLPLTDYAAELLAQLPREGEYVFPGSGERGFLIEPKRQVAKIIDASGVEFALHDLRRTFTTVAEGLDIPAYALKRLLNHKMTNDVTAGYIVSDVEPLREPMQKITDFMLKAAGLGETAQPIALADQRAQRHPKGRVDRA